MNQQELNPNIYKQTWSFYKLPIVPLEKHKKRSTNVYSVNGHIYYELPNGELTKDEKSLTN